MNIKLNDKVPGHTDFMFAVILEQAPTQAGLKPAVLLGNTTLSKLLLTFFLPLYFSSYAEQYVWSLL